MNITLKPSRTLPEHMLINEEVATSSKTKDRHYFFLCHCGFFSWIFLQRSLFPFLGGILSLKY